jgi:hypothetical protein
MEDKPRGQGKNYKNLLGYFMGDADSPQENGPRRSTSTKLKWLRGPAISFGGSGVAGLAADGFHFPFATVVCFTFAFYSAMVDTLSRVNTRIFGSALKPRWQKAAVIGAGGAVGATMGAAASLADLGLSNDGVPVDVTGCWRVCRSSCGVMTIRESGVGSRNR